MDVFIAGTGAVCAAGIGSDLCAEAVRRGADFLKPWTIPAIPAVFSPLCAEVPCETDLLTGREGLYRTLALALAAASEAMLALTDRYDLRCEVVTATTVGGISRTEQAYGAYRQDPEAITTLAVESAVHEPAVLSSEICRSINGCGFHTVSTACSSSLHAIGMAKRLIERECCDACLVVGADALCITTVRGFGSLTLLDPKGCRPFDRDRAGISLGEGAGALLLVSSRVLDKVPITPLAQIGGWGASSDCYHMTAPHPQGTGAKAAMSAALDETGIAPEDIDCILAHGTGTPDNDRAEIAAARSLFDPLPPFCSVKRTLGHTLAASGILESVVAVHMLRDGFIPPTGGFSNIDEEIGVSPAASCEKPLRTIIKNAFGFGGNNASLVLCRPGYNIS